MGRSWPQTTLIALKEAMEILNASEVLVHAWVQRSVLEEVGSDEGPRYRLDQVESLSRFLPNAGPIDLGTLAARAELAYIKSATVERRLDELCDLLGLRRNVLDLHEQAVRALDQTVEEALLSTCPPSIETLRYWAGTFFSIDEPYLCLIEKYLLTPEPWKRYMDLGYKLALGAPRELFDSEPAYRPAMGYLDSAREHLRMVAYFYCREGRGVETAEQIFGAGSKVTDRIMGLLYPY